MDARRRASTRPYNFQINFEGGLQSNVRAQLINELVKYILYERQQIPMTFDQIKRDWEHEKKTQEQKQDVNARQKTSMLHRRQIKKVADLVTKLDTAFKNIFHAFEISPEVQKAAIVIGATPVSPKEIYLVELPPLSPDADNLPVNKCVKSLFYQLIKLDPMERVSQIHPTNTFILLYAPRHSNIQWFYPKPLYKIPMRGKHFYFQLQSSCCQGNHNLSKNFTVFDLSGFEALDSSVDDTSMVSDIPEESTSSSSRSSITADYVCVESDHDYDIIDSSVIDTTQINEDDMDADCSKLSVASSKGSNKSYISTSTIFTRPSALTKSLSAGCIESSYCSEKAISPLEIEQSCSSGEKDPLVPEAKHDYIWFQSPELIKGYRDELSHKMM